MLFRFSLFIVVILCLFSCKKEIFSTDENAFLSTNITTGDSLKFDTVFTQTTTPVKIFKIFNHNRENILIDKIELAGKNNSPYKVNINGVTSADFTDITLPSGDSLYVFVNLTVPASQAVAPFEVTDSLGLFFNNKKKNIVLNAVAQNAVHLDEAVYTSSTTWKNNLPIIVKGNITIAKNAVLNIEPGTKIYFQNGAGIIVNGSLNAGGTPAERIIFKGFRNDDDYKYLPGMWNGVRFGADAGYSQLNYVTIENAKVAIADTLRTLLNSSGNAVFNGCILQNNITGMQLKNTNISMVNSLIANCRNAFTVNSGGKYNIQFSTFAGYGNSYVPHDAPLIQLSDADKNGSNAQTLTFTLSNAIVYGALDDEISITQSGNNDAILIEHSIYKSRNLPNVSFKNSLQNVEPKFLELNDRAMQYNFRVASDSPAKGFGVPGSNPLSVDILGIQRSATAPTIGCFE